MEKDFNVTLMRVRGENTSFTRSTLSELVEDMRNGKYSKRLTAVRDALNFLSSKAKAENLTQLYQETPLVCFTAEIRKKEGNPVIVGYNRLVLLEFNGLPSCTEAERLRKLVSHIPYTMLAFVGGDGKSLKVLCKFTCAEGISLENMQRNAYKRLSYVYASQLDLAVDAHGGEFDGFCLVSDDAGLYFHPDASPVVVSDKDSSVPVFHAKGESLRSETVLPGLDAYRSACHLYEFCLKSAYEKACVACGANEPLENDVLDFLADECHVSGLEEEFSVQATLRKRPFGNDERLVRLKFDNAYRKWLSRKIPFKNIDEAALLTYRMEAFMETRYEIRMNVMKGVPQYRVRNGLDIPFNDLTSRVRATIAIEALKAGLRSWDRDLDRYLASDAIKRYDPVRDYLAKLPEWDGKDRVTAFANRFPTRHPDFAFRLHVWMRSMVAQWIGEDEAHGNAIVPLLIGKQGCGKSWLCRTVLPPELMEYYDDRIDFRSDTDVYMGLSRFALINIDEFDSLKKSQQPLLKYILQKKDVKLRMPFGRTVEKRRRYASFIGTTNSLHPLTDKSGSRRFLCVRIEDGSMIDNTSPVDYPQMYAQLYAEVRRGDRYWFNKEETAEIMRHNEDYLGLVSLESIVSSLFQKPEGDKGVMMSLVDILQCIEKEYSTFRTTKYSHRSLGRILTAEGYESKRTMKGKMYYVQTRM